MGCAGGKDISKRPLMGLIASNIADYIYFTSEDPRSENPLSIINDLIKDIKKNNYEIIIDRKKAIRKAIMEANAQDTIIITGKGNDNYFEVDNIIYPYSDIEEVIYNLEQRKKTVRECP